MGAWEHLGLLQGDLADLVLFLAAISVFSWGVVGVTILLRFGAYVRYKHRPRTMRSSVKAEKVHQP
jgi:hypothetical protein